MYLILEIKPNLNTNQINSDNVVINSDTPSNISFALKQLECVAKEFIREEFGNSVVNNTILEEIDDITELNEPERAGIYLYKTKNDNMSVYVYQKREKNMPGYIWGSSSVLIFECIKIFIIKEYSGTKHDIKHNDVEFVKVNKMNLPKPMTISPFCDLIKSLKESEKFLKRKEKND